MALVELQDPVVLRWIALFGCAALVGLTKAGFGAGAGILSVPLMVIALGDAREMLPIMLPVLICGDIFSIVHYPKKKDWRTLKMLIPSCLGGVLVGTLVLYHLETRGATALDGASDARAAVSSVLNYVIGGVCLVFLLVQVWRLFRESRLTERPGPYTPKTWHGLLVGTLAGITSTLCHAAGPLIALFLLPQKLDKKFYVGTCVTYFFVGNVAKIPGYLWLGYLTWPKLCTSLVLMPAVIAGTFAGLALHKKFTGRYFVIFIYACTLATLIKLLLF